MPRRDDYTLGIEEVSKRLNKSVRTIHRYKDSGRLSFEVGASQGNPLFFSRSEVEELARELFPHQASAVPAADPQFWERLERVERLLAVLEANPNFERMLTRVGDARPDSRPQLEAMLGDLIQLDHGHKKLDNQALGRLLIQLGNMLLEA